MNIYTEYDPNSLTELCYIMSKYGSDKSKLQCNGHHNYTTYYMNLFNTVKYNKLRIFELGLGTNNILLPSNMGKDGKPGASLKGWKEFFPNSYIYGADIDRDILFNEERINTYYCDQLDRDVIKNMWNEPELIENFDIIIEDGLHTYDANKSFFENSIHKLNVGGVYIIEDVIKSKLSEYYNLINKWKNEYSNLDIRIVDIPGANNTYDNILIVIQKK